MRFLAWACVNLGIVVLPSVPLFFQCWRVRELRDENELLRSVLQVVTEVVDHQEAELAQLMPDRIPYLVPRLPMSTSIAPLKADVVIVPVPDPAPDAGLGPARVLEYQAPPRVLIASPSIDAAQRVDRVRAALLRWLRPGSKS